MFFSQVHPAVHLIFWRPAPLPHTSSLHAGRLFSPLLLHRQVWTKKVIILSGNKIFSTNSVCFLFSYQYNVDVVDWVWTAFFFISFSFFWLGTMSFTVWNTFRHLKATKVLFSFINQSNILQSFMGQIVHFPQEERYIIAAKSKSTNSKVASSWEWRKF